MLRTASARTVVQQGINRRDYLGAATRLNHAGQLDASHEQDESRNRSHAVTGSHLRIQIDVQLGDPDPFGHASSHRLDFWFQPAAGSTPSRPEVDKYRDIAFEHLDLKVVGSHPQYLSHANGPCPYLPSCASAATGNPMVVRIIPNSQCAMVSKPALGQNSELSEPACSLSRAHSMSSSRQPPCSPRATLAPSRPEI